MHTKIEQIKNNKGQSQNAVAVLNDKLRTQHIGGRIMMTRGISSLDKARIHSIIHAIASFTDFNTNNDPYGEHDCAILEVEGMSIMWKIDYYDETLNGHSPDASNPDVTVRIMTVMLAEEY